MKAGPAGGYDRMRIDAELRKLAVLEQRLDDVDALVGDPDRLREAVAPILSEVLRDAGTADPKRVSAAIAPYVVETIRVELSQTLSDRDRMREAVAPALSGALRDAGTVDHAAVASAMAPYMVDTIHAEILNSQDELVEAIHPKLGTLIRSAIANAIEELNRKVDEALPVDRWIAAVKARLTGGPAAGFLLGGAGNFKVREALLIDRKSGVLIARRGMAGDDEAELLFDEDLMAGMIAALQGFADDTYGPSGAGDFRRFSFTEDTVYLRASPTKILAVRCSGEAPADIATRIDMLLERVLDEARGDGDLDGTLRIDDFSGVTDEAGDTVSASRIAAGVLGGLAAAVLLIWGEGAAGDAHRDRWLAAAEQAALSDAAIGPYPLAASYAAEGDSILLTGLVADEGARARLAERVEWAAIPIPVQLDVAVIARDAPR